MSLNKEILNQFARLGGNLVRAEQAAAASKGPYILEQVQREQLSTTSRLLHIPISTTSACTTSIVLSPRLSAYRTHRTYSTLR